MPTEAGPAAVLANMSAPPRSVVLLPRLRPAPGYGPGGTVGPAVGPGGGQRVSHALCLARIELAAAVCAWLQIGRGSARLGRPLGLARALVLLARTAAAGCPAGPAPRQEVARVANLTEAALLDELTRQLLALPWPDWVPPVAMAQPLGQDPALGLSRKPPVPTGVDCPLLAARLVSAIRGPVFLRRASPSLTHLLDLQGGDVPSLTWELWLPLRPGASS